MARLKLSQEQTRVSRVAQHATSPKTTLSSREQATKEKKKKKKKKKKKNLKRRFLSPSEIVFHN
jgi:predicted amidophosphoribosyltransferase